MSKPTINSAYSETTLSLVDSKYENGSLIETFTMIEENYILPGHTSICDPTKFDDELFEWTYSEAGKLTRTFAVVKKDGVESSRKLVDYELNLAINSTSLEGIRGGFRVIGGK